MTTCHMPHAIVKNVPPPHTDQTCSNKNIPLLRGIIVNRTYGTHKNLHISLFFPTIFGHIYYGPPQYYFCSTYYSSTRMHRGRCKLSTSPLPPTLFLKTKNASRGGSDAIDRALMLHASLDPTTVQPFERSGQSLPPRHMRHQARTLEATITNKQKNA